ncbi:MAG TPA: hypothetical protein VES68_00990, partial [Candidatus Sulfotelmatobacter sp.]|nr:hypothetical protein [Candidatus Sulfotelmatobacter sp.]
MKKTFFRKFINFISILAILSQSLTPYAVLLPQTASAQETTVTPTDTPTPTVDQSQVTPTDTATPTPTVDQTTPTDQVTPTPTDVPTDTVTPTPDNSGTPTDTPPVNNNSPPSSDNSSNNNSNSSNSSTTPTDVPTISPAAPVTIDPTQEGLTSSTDTKTGNEQVSFTILKNASAPSIDLGAVESQGSAALTTDKPDYSPTDTALITGSALLPNTTYSLTIFSNNPPAVSTTVNVTSDDKGVFAYAYQLDGNYRPAYSAVLKDSTGNSVASTTFTDSPSSTTTLSNAVCLQDNPKSPSGLNCTANDVSLGAATNLVVTGPHGCRFPGDIVTFTADYSIAANATSRYNVGVYFGTAGQASALTGPTNTSCSVTSHPSSPSPFFDGGTSCGGIN